MVAFTIAALYLLPFLLLMIPNGLFFFEYRSICEIEF